MSKFDKKGRKTGYWKEPFIKSYSIACEGVYKKGEREGLWKYLAEDNSLVFKVYFINDEEKKFVGYNLSHKIHREVIFI